MSNSIKWQSPSNIALVKYWGKRDKQIPTNASISFTLKNCHTTTELIYESKETTADYDINVFLEDELKESFKPKIISFFDNISHKVSFLKQYKFTIKTSNSFPHSSGIASSASGMSALALCICSMEEQLTDKKFNKADFLKRASMLSRLGSGSACRSLYPGLASWGKHEAIPGSSDEYATPFTDAHPIFKDFQDTILLVDQGQKEVSSTVGHSLMNGHPFAANRFQEANKNLSIIKDILKNGNLQDFTKLVEQEALMLHAMMMTSDPYFLLFKPNTLQIINKIWEYRNQNNTNFVITLDAGANVHFLYPKSEATEAMTLINNELIAFCENNAYISDEVGSGPIQLA